jgi:non-specific protein-tyrosine kinase
MATDVRYLTLRDYATIVVRRKWVVIAAVLLSTAFAVGLIAAQTPIYSASSKVLVQPRGQDGLFENQIVNLNERAIDTEIQLIEGEAVRSRVQQNLDLASRPPSANASAVGQTDVISIAVRDPNASNAAVVSNAYASAYIEVRREQAVNELLAASAEVQGAVDDLQAQIDALEDDDPRRTGLISQLSNFQTTLDQLRVDAALRTGGAAVVESAEAPTEPVEPTPLRTVSLAAMAGLIIGLAAAFLLDYLDDKVRSEDDVERLVQRPVLAVVPVDPPPDNRPVAISEPGHDAVEQYRGLRTNLQFLSLDRPISVVQVTSALAGEGKTTTATNLAVVLAQGGHRVALVDADLRRPRVHEVFCIPQSPGFTDLLLGKAAKSVVNHLDIDGRNGLSVFTSGTVPSTPSEMLSSQRAHQLLNEMGGHYDYVVVDSAPILPVSDSVALSRAVDGVVVVAQAGNVTEGDLVEAIERLDRVSAPILGLVLNRVTRSSSGGYGYGGYSAYAAPNHAQNAPPPSPSTTHEAAPTA